MSSYLKEIIVNQGTEHNTGEMAETLAKFRVLAVFLMYPYYA
jgi:hypothetical protein